MEDRDQLILKILKHIKCLRKDIREMRKSIRLATIANDFGEEIETLYWQNIKVAYVKKLNPIQVINRLTRVNRYDEALELIYHNKDSQIPDSLKVNVELLIAAIHAGSFSFAPRRNNYYFC